MRGKQQRILRRPQVHPHDSYVYDLEWRKTFWGIPYGCWTFVVSAPEREVLKTYFACSEEVWRQ